MATTVNYNNSKKIYVCKKMACKHKTVQNKEKKKINGNYIYTNTFDRQLNMN